MISLVQLVKKQVSVGYSGLLLIGDSLLLLVIGIDVIRFISRSLSLDAALRLPLQLTIPHAAKDITVFFVLLIIVIPLITGFARVILTQVPLKRVELRVRYAAPLHLFVMTPILLFGLLICIAMRVLGGGSYTSDAVFRDAFVPYTELGIHTLPLLLVHKLLALRPSTIGGLLLFYAAVYLGYRQVSGTFTDYKSALALADIDERCVPSRSSRGGLFQMRSQAPETRFVANYVDRIMTRSGRLNPATSEATVQILQLAEQCKRLVTDMLLPTVDGYDIFLLPDHASGVRLALESVRAVRRIIVSPFEGPVASILLASYNQVDAGRIVDLSFSEDKWLEPWEIQQALFCRQVECACPDKREPLLLLISEVNYWTGTVVPLDRLVPMLRLIGYEQLTVLVDGTRSVGNAGTARFLEQSDIYLFGAQTWLMASTQCEVLVRNKRLGQCPDLALNVWEASPIFSPANIRAMAALCGGLSMVEHQREGFRSLWLRSNMLRQIFISRIAANFDVLGEEKGGCQLDVTHMAVVRPRGFWKAGASEALANIGLSVEKLGGASKGVVAVTFPYYLNLWELFRAGAILNDSVTDARLPTFGDLPKQKAAAA